MQKRNGVPEYPGQDSSGGTPGPFVPPGLLFGLLYAWYIDNRFGSIVDYEMSLLRWRISELIPKPSMERGRMKARVDFFRRVVFRQEIPAAVLDLL